MTAKCLKQILKVSLVTILSGTIFLLTPSLSFSQSQKSIANLYSSYLKGLLNIEKGEYSSGLAELEKAKNRDPRSIHIRLKIASVLIRLKRIGEAEKVLKEAKKIEPTNLDISLSLIFVYSYAGKDKELEAEYEGFLKKAHELKPKDVSVSEYLAQFYFYKKRPQEAIMIYERMLETNPEYIEAIFWLGYLYEETGSRSKAVDVWKKGLDIDSSFAPILNSLGYIYAQAGLKLNEAESMIKKALEKEPENGAYLDSLGWVYFKKGDFSKAKEYLTKAIIYLKDPEIFEHLGDLYIRLGDVNKGLSYYQDGFLQFPGNKELELKSKKYGKENKAFKK